MHSSLASLWLPIIVSTAVVFVLSSIINMFLWHKGDYAALPNGETIAESLRAAKVAPGAYMYPRPSTMAEMGTAEHRERVLRGPRVLMTVAQRKSMSMAPMLVQWTVYVLIVTILAACMALAANTSGDEHMTFHVVGLFSWAAYAFALWPLSIWYARPWRNTLFATFDGLIYAVATGFIFAWLAH